MSQDFFLTNLGRVILRDGRRYTIPKFDSGSKNYEVCKLLYELQAHGIEFKPLVINTNSVCVSCEG